MVDRWGQFWFAFSLGIMAGVLMFTYVAIPSRLLGLQPEQSRRDKLSAAAVGGAIGADHLLAALRPGPDRHPHDRLPQVLRYLAILLLAIAVVLQTGATSAVKAVKMSAKIVAGSTPEEADAEVFGTTLRGRRVAARRRPGSPGPAEFGRTHAFCRSVTRPPPTGSAPVPAIAAVGTARAGLTERGPASGQAGVARVEWCPHRDGAGRTDPGRRRREPVTARESRCRGHPPRACRTASGKVTGQGRRQGARGQGRACSADPPTEPVSGRLSRRSTRTASRK